MATNPVAILTDAISRLEKKYNINEVALHSILSEFLMHIHETLHKGHVSLALTINSEMKPHTIFGVLSGKAWERMITKPLKI